MAHNSVDVDLAEDELTELFSLEAVGIFACEVAHIALRGLRRCHDAHTEMVRLDLDIELGELLLETCSEGGHTYYAASRHR